MRIKANEECASGADSTWRTRGWDGSVPPVPVDIGFVDSTGGVTGVGEPSSFVPTNVGRPPVLTGGTYSTSVITALAK